MGLFYFLLSCHGLTQILVYGKVFDKIRPTQGWMGQLLSCTMCTGFWVGLLLWSINTHTTLFSFDNNYTTGILLGFIASAVSYTADILFGDDGIKIEHK